MIPIWCPPEGSVDWSPLYKSFRFQLLTFVESGLFFLLFHLWHSPVFRALWKRSAIKTYAPWMPNAAVNSTVTPLYAPFRQCKQPGSPAAELCVEPGSKHWDLQMAACLLPLFVHVCCVLCAVCVSQANGFTGDGVGYLLPCVIECNDYRCCVMWF